MLQAGHCWRRLAEPVCQLPICSLASARSKLKDQSLIKQSAQIRRIAVCPLDWTGKMVFGLGAPSVESRVFKLQITFEVIFKIAFSCLLFDQPVAGTPMALQSFAFCLERPDARL